MTVDINPKKLDASAALFMNLIDAVDHPFVIGTPGSVLAALCRRVAAAVCLTCFIGSAAAEDARPPRYVPGPQDLMKSCQRGHRVEFVFPAATFYFELQMIDPFTIIDLFHRYGATCPTEPVKVVRVDLSFNLANELKIKSGLGQPFIRMGLGSDSSHEPPAPPIPRPAAIPPGEPWIEDVTLITIPPEFRDQKVVNDRLYDLHYDDTDGRPRVARITCAGVSGQRACESGQGWVDRNPYADVYVSYNLQQNQLPIPDLSKPASQDPSTESGALLEFNVRFHAWLRRMTEKP